MHRRDFAVALLAPAVVDLSRAHSRARVEQESSAGINPPSGDFVASLPFLMEVASVPGVAMSVVQGDKVVWQHHAGIADRRTGRPVASDTLWPAASLSKPVFALAVLRLVDAKKLDLDTPLRRYLPTYAADDARGNSITARHVLSHSSGLPNWRRDDQPLVPAFQPGSRFQYSGEGYYYLERVVEHVAGMGFEQFMQQSVFSPLGMSSSTYIWRADVASRVVAGHDRDQSYPVSWQDIGNRLQEEAKRQNRALDNFTGEEIVAILQTMTPRLRTLPNFLIPNSASSLVTTPADYGAFLVAILDPHGSKLPLQKSTRDAMLTSQTPIDSALSWGLGWGLERRSLTTIGPHALTPVGTDFIWHWGDNGAWKNFVLAHPTSRSAIVIFTNGARGLNVAQRITTAATGIDHAAFWGL
jgi:CubicO group peptidase (beta-lactamase class C family)